MINPVSMVLGGGSDEFTRPANTTAYGAGDRIAATTSDSDTTALRRLFRATKPAGRGYLTSLLLQTNLDTFLDQVRIHLFTVSAPTTAIPGDNSPMGVVFANRAEYLGFLDFAALAEPVTASVSDMTQAVLTEKRIAFECAAGDDGIYYALQTLGTGTPSSGQTFRLLVKTRE